MPESQTITLYPSNWLYNAGVVGFLRVLDFGGENVENYFKNDGSVEIEMSELENFEVFYFEYVSKLYLLQRINLRELREFFKNKIPIDEVKKINAKIVKIESQISQKILGLKSTKNWKDFEADLRELKEFLLERIKEIQIEFNEILETDKNREKLERVVNNLNKNDIFDSIVEFKGQADFLGAFYFNKDVVANPKGKNPYRIANFRRKYLEPAIKLNSGDNLCILCGRRYSEEGLSELTEGDFSILGISKDEFANFYSYYLNSGYSYNRKCSLCQLMLLCAFAGLNYKPFPLRELDETEYIFVNYPILKDAFEVNNKLREEFKNFQFGIFTERINTYLKVLELTLATVTKKTRWLLENTYFAEIKVSMKKDQTKPKFVYFNIDKAFAEVFEEFNIGSLLKSLSFPYEICKNTWVYLSTEVLKRLLEKKPIIYIAFKMSSEKLTEKNNDLSTVWNLVLLEFIINQKRRSNMSAKTSYGILKAIQEEGERSFSLEEIDQEKRFHISQRFLTLIRGARKEDFYNELLRLFIVYRKPVPEILFSLLTESEVITFQEKALAFLTGFINPKEEKSLETKEVSHE